MLNLPTSNPDIHEQMVDGNFATQRTSQPFSQTPMDQTLEQTLNKNSKTKGGTIGFSINKSAVHRWIKSFADRAEIQSVCESMAGRGNHTRQRKEVDINRRRQDEKSVKSVISTIEAMINPVSIEDDELVNIVSGAVATPEVKEDIARAKTAGEEQCSEYIDQRLKKKKQEVFEAIKALKLKTFSSTTKTAKAKSEKTVLQTTARDLARVLIVAKSNNLDFKYVLSFPLCPVPLSLANYDGTLAKTDKSAMGRFLEKNVEDVTNSNSSTAWIIDAMALIQRLKDIPSTFDALSAKILKIVIDTAIRHRCTRVDFVADRYPDSSIKNAERDRRKEREGSVIRLKVDHGSKKTPKQFKKFLSVGRNKESLIEFLFEHWKTVDASSLQGVELYFAHGCQCHKFQASATNLTVESVDVLFSDHEEADTRMELHALHAFQLHEEVTIQSDDTDVLIICIGLNTQFSGKLFIQRGTKANLRTINIESVISSLPDGVADALLGLHPFTGCDSVSCWKGKGKVTPYELMITNPSYISAFSALGQEWSISNVPMDVLEQFLCQLYNRQSVLPSLLDVRLSIFMKKFCLDSKLPPVMDEVIQHTKRANYQAAILRRSLESVINAPSPIGHGWMAPDGECELAIQWRTVAVAPPELLEQIYCSCRKTKCSTRSCSCFSRNMRCGPLCKCTGCENGEQVFSEIANDAVDDILNGDDSDSDLDSYML